MGQSQWAKLRPDCSSSRHHDRDWDDQEEEEQEQEIDGRNRKSQKRTRRRRRRRRTNSMFSFSDTFYQEDQAMDQRRGDNEDEERATTKSLDQEHRRRQVQVPIVVGCPPNFDRIVYLNTFFFLPGPSFLLRAPADTFPVYPRLRSFCPTAEEDTETQTERKARARPTSRPTSQIAPTTFSTG